MLCADACVGSSDEDGDGDGEEAWKVVSAKHAKNALLVVRPQPRLRWLAQSLHSR